MTPGIFLLSSCHLAKSRRKKYFILHAKRLPLPYVPQTFSTWTHSRRRCNDPRADQQHAQPCDDQRTFHFSDPRCHPCIASVSLCTYSGCHRFVFRSSSHLRLAPHAIHSCWFNFFRDRACRFATGCL